jgi:hypothetical protein
MATFLRRGLAVFASPLLGLLIAAGCSGGSGTATTATTGTSVPGTTTTLPETPLDKGKQLATYNPDTGDCFDKRKVVTQTGAKPTDIYLKLDCVLPHQNEVFAVVDAPWPDQKDRTYPGDDTIRKAAKVECPKKYAEYVGKPYEVSKLEIGYLLPPEASWPSYRRIGCYVYNAAGLRMEGSVKGTGG